MSTKAIQGKLWSIAPRYWSQHFEPGFLPLYREALEQLGSIKTKLLLDAGCGSGMFTSLAIKAGAQVIGVDAAPGLLEVARERNPHNNFLEEDLESLPFADDSFHVVTGFNSFQFASDFKAAVREAQRVLRPGGKLVIGIWDLPERSDASIVLKAIGALIPPPPPGTPGPFALSEDGKIEGILKEIGFKLNSKTVVACPFTYSSLTEGIRSFMGTGPAAAAMYNSTKLITEDAIGRALRQFRVTEDIHFLQNHFLLFVAEK
jgi:Methylase involved in ubiquinone/menaquinone biosynthesis